ncbi:alpha/beta hydrolase [Vulcaniibacterium tengchongense]|uniref:Pimeloyl-ACP methyl ester carboxylesterase n=1 Tax=Vulcaniibacterium tengchongense TaxID=1273429 RepID=A0A3N4W216_9GAMM|nr:alpha/beta hydrolase [Vulcaniibacterium tengchongense]RPE80110.1 pimeloyl-ACP methyl ester carboxylesterase [Vulcaniibacterium tengchongense]
MPDFRWRLAAVATALLLAGCGGGARNADDTAGVRRYGALAFAPCTLSGGAGASIAAQCTTLSVPENPAAPQGRAIALRIAWLPATDAAGAAPDPVFFLTGGPGQAATESWPAVDPAFAEVRKRRHVILVDQRGTGGSHPLICRDAQGRSAVADEGAAGSDEIAGFARRCAGALDADPRHYTTTDAVADLERVRAALGAETVDLVGASYGTRVAQQYAMRHPRRVRAMVLDGLVPNELALGAEHARNLDASLALQFAKCRELPACGDRFGDTRARLRALMRRLREAPVEVAYRDPGTGEERRGTLGADTVAGLTRLFAYAPEAASLLPLVLSEADQGRYAALMALSRLVQDQLGEQIAHGMQLSVLCAEDADLLTPDPAEADTVLGTALVDLLRAQCAVWPRGRRPADFHRPLRSDAPALLLSGEFDPVTPPRYGEQVLAGLPNGRHLVLRGRGHGSFAVGCVPKLLGRFLETADAKALDASCLDSVGYVPPFTGFNGWEP